MFDVNLYLEVSHQDCIRKRKRHYRYVLEFELRDGRLFTRDGAGYGEEVSAQEIALMALTDAVGRINRPSEIHIYTGCRELTETGWIGRLRVWRGNGFLTASGTPVRNRQLWEHLACMLDSHLVSVEGTEHSYRMWMLSELAKEEGKGGNHGNNRAG